jgi:hypothetical protein
MVELDEKSVNPPNVHLSPADFQLLKLLGTGGYGKVSFKIGRIVSKNLRYFWPKRSAA